MRSPAAKREGRILRALERQAVAAERSTGDKVQRLIERGHGHCAEATRLDVKRRAELAREKGKQS